MSKPTAARLLLDEVSGGLRDRELAEKYGRVAALLEREQLGALVVRRHENIAWLTAGQVEARVAIPSETAVTSLVVLRDGRCFYLAPSNEAARLAAEEFGALGYEPVLYPWWDDGAAALAGLVGTGSVAGDAGASRLLDLTPLRAPLTEAEVLRYRWLGRETAAVVAEVLATLKPGVSEYQMEALVAGPLLAKGILPSVLLMAVDDRIRYYKHAVARGAILERFGMLNLCARKWGMAVSITRFAHFGPLPEDLARGFRVAAQVNAVLLQASKPGATSAELYATAAATYAAAGAPGEEKNHHQGGPAGYAERDWLATPSGTQTLASVQGVAWNPSAFGGKVEETTLITPAGAETLTSTPTLPQVETSVGGQTYISAGVLLR
jgi:Xaa-Pro dipeptidase